MLSLLIIVLCFQSAGRKHTAVQRVPEDTEPSVRAEWYNIIRKNNIAHAVHFSIGWAQCGNGQNCPLVRFISCRQLLRQSSECLLVCNISMDSVFVSNLLSHVFL